MTLYEGEHLLRGLAGYLRNANVSVRLDCGLEDFASFRECLSRQILATPDEHIERIEHDERLRRTVILKQIEVWLSLRDKCDDLAIDHWLIRQARQGHRLHI
jgi:hypothetical protein